MKEGPQSNLDWLNYWQDEVASRQANLDSLPPDAELQTRTRAIDSLQTAEALRDAYAHVLKQEM